MNLQLKNDFLSLWEKYFGQAELPITCWYGQNDGSAIRMEAAKRHSCLIGELVRVRKGEGLAYDENAINCGGAMRYLGFAKGIRPNFNYFLSCGIPGELEGERYIRTPELVNKLMKGQHNLNKQGEQIIFKRWDKLTEKDAPELVIFFASPDVLSGLFTLANFDQSEPNTTFSPFGAGCGSIIHYPYNEIQKERPRAVIGMFDPSARPFVSANVLSFSVPFIKFEKMVGYMEESFLITPTWGKVKKRILKG